MTVDEDVWWKNISVYQIWPASFKDSNGDGIGDIPGIISTLDYVKSLGVDVIWLSPMYESPQEDMGYDISDYQKIHGAYGTMENMNDLILQVHKRGMKLILDLVINHTSVEHKWFQESRSSKTSPKRDWYIWKPPKYDANGNRLPPNNWASVFSGSAWEYDELTDEYYLHIFAKGQPDLNWENATTRQAIYDEAIIFWLEKGIDGFRIDTAAMYSKDQTFDNVPIVNPNCQWQPCISMYQNGPRIHEFHKEMYQKTFSKYDAFTVGEIGSASVEESLKYVSLKANELNMMFLFDMLGIGIGRPPISKDLVRFKNVIKKNFLLMDEGDGWSTFYLENHDQPRSISVFGDDSSKYREKSGKLLTLLQTTLSGTLFLYQGQEIGMTNIPKDWPIECYLDIESNNYYKENGVKSLGHINQLARDNGRTPVQWNGSKNAGFTTGEPWMRINDNYPYLNIQAQESDPESLLAFWKRCLKMRKMHKSFFIHGKLNIIDENNEDVLYYSKDSGDGCAYVALNFSRSRQRFVNHLSSNLQLLVSNLSFSDSQWLEPFEGRVYLCE